MSLLLSAPPDNWFKFSSVWLSLQFSWDHYALILRRTVTATKIKTMGSLPFISDPDFNSCLFLVTAFSSSSSPSSTRGRSLFSGMLRTANILPMSLLASHVYTPTSDWNATEHQILSFSMWCLFGSVRSSRCHNVCLSVCMSVRHKVVLKHWIFNLSSKAWSAMSMSVRTFAGHLTLLWPIWPSP